MSNPWQPNNQQAWGQRNPPSSHPPTQQYPATQQYPGQPSGMFPVGPQQGGSLPPGPPGGGGFPGGPPGEPPRRNTTTIVAIVVAAVLVIAGGITTVILMNSKDNASGNDPEGPSTSESVGNRPKSLDPNSKSSRSNRPTDETTDVETTDDQTTDDQTTDDETTDDETTPAPTGEVDPAVRDGVQRWFGALADGDVDGVVEATCSQMRENTRRHLEKLSKEDLDLMRGMKIRVNGTTVSGDSAVANVTLEFVGDTEDESLELRSENDHWLLCDPTMSK